MVYVRALQAALTILEHAKAAAPLMKNKKKVDAQVAKLHKAYPGFAITVEPPPLPMFDAASVATGIAGERTAGLEAGRMDMLRDLLTKLYEDQCRERFVLVWRAPTKPRGKDGIVNSAGRLQEDQLARAVLLGVAALLDLRSLERSELPIVAVAAGFDVPANQSDARLPTTFEQRADRWRQDSQVVAGRLLTLLPHQLVKRIRCTSTVFAAREGAGSVGA